MRRQRSGQAWSPQSWSRQARRRATWRVVPALGAVLAVLLAGCGSDEPQPAPPPETSTATTQEALPTTGPATSTEVSEPATPTSASTTTGPTTSLPEPTSSVTPAPTTGPGPTSRPSSTTRPTPTPTVTPPPITTPPDDLVGAWRGSDIESFRTDRSIVALTFDGGASNTGVADILATLAEEEVPATFFVTGQFARAYPASVRAIAAAGHPVGNHSDTHPHFPAATNEQIRTELRAADASISALTGTGTAPLFRFPFGDRTALDIEVVNEAGYVPVRWTVDTLGWQGTEEGITTAVVRQRVLDTLRPGQVVLMHVGAHPEDGSTVDADALPGLIDDLRARGYGFVTVTQLLAAGS